MKNNFEKTTFMLDIDGVCCNFVSPALDIFGKKDIIWPDGETSTVER